MKSKKKCNCRYRGRGGYYNRGMYRGGYRGNYRGQGQRNMRPNQGNPNIQPQSQPVAAAAGNVKYIDKFIKLVVINFKCTINLSCNNVEHVVILHDSDFFT